MRHSPAQPKCLAIDRRAHLGARAGGRQRTVAGLLVVVGMLLATPMGGAVAPETGFIAFDLGTLDGFDAESLANSVNDSGQVVGYSRLSRSGATHAFLWTRAGGMIDLGTLGGSRSEAVAVNAAGQVIGTSDTAGAELHAFSWTGTGGMVDLGVASLTSPYRVSDAGQVVGVNGRGAFSWTETGGMFDLGAAIGRWASYPQAVNARGQVVGTSYDEFRPNAQIAIHAFSWTPDGGVIEPALPGGFSSAASDVNASGQVVGWYCVSPPIPNFYYCHPSTGPRAFSWTEAAGMTDMHPPGALSSQVRAVNDRGEMFGGVTDSSGRSFAAFWTADGRIIELSGGFGPHTTTWWPIALNAGGQVVGSGELLYPGRAEHAVSWTEAGGPVDLGTLGGSSSNARAVNNRGQVVGYSYTRTPTGDGPIHAVLWEPIANLGCHGTLAGCNLQGMNLGGAYLVDANLTGTQLIGADLTGANLSGANLTRANLKDANLTGANLTNAQLDPTHVLGAIWSNTVCPDGTNSDAAGGTCVHEGPGALLWKRTLDDAPFRGGGPALSVALDNQGNAVAAGSTGNTQPDGVGISEFNVTKFDGRGAVLWQQLLRGTGNGYQGTQFNEARSVAVDQQGNVAAAGYTTNIGRGQDFTVAKFAAAGELLWLHALNGTSTDDTANSVAIDHQGNVVAAGRVQGLFTVAKFDPDGILLWEQQLPRFGSASEAAQVAVDDEGDVVAAGETGNIEGPRDFTVVKLDPNGFVLWQQNLHGTVGNPDRANSVAVDHAGNVAAAGYFSNTPGRTGRDFTVAKFDRDGTLLWLQNIDGILQNTDFANSVAMDNNGNVVAAGRTFNTGANTDFTVAKFDRDGALLWQRDLRGPRNGSAVATSVAVDEAGNVVAGGGTDQIHPIFALLTVAKFAPDGALLWQQDLPHGFARSIAVDQRGRVAAAGTTNLNFSVAMFDR
jgi:uncharacterized delta-60 repeat protein